MDSKLQKKAAKEFADRWKGRGYEKGESQPFWLSLLRDVYGVEHPEDYIFFEDQVHLDHTSFIDGYIPETRVMIEQKGLGKDLNTPIRQSDGTYKTPFDQAKRYISDLPVSQHPMYVVTSNFETFQIYDMNKPHGEPEVIKLADLEKDYYRLQFLVNEHDTHIQEELDVSVAAGEIVGKLYDAFREQYDDPDSPETLHSLNVLCVRLVFCLYAENAGIFGGHTMFYDYLEGLQTYQLRDALEKLFKVLDQSEDQRNKYLSSDNPELAAFPYVNGGLFSDENIEIPPFTDEIRDLLLEQASAGFDWSGISPTIFGAVFESTLNPETRRSGGMHYTSVENIHKVIDPLFLDDLDAEFEEIQQIDVERTRRRKLQDFQKKLSSLTFLDPACGSGNFLTETYLSLRRLENDVLRELTHGQITMGDTDFTPIQVSLNQLYGIEINDFAVTVAKTALWIAESQMMQQTEDIVHMSLDFLPLKSYTNIIEGNALRIDWNDVVPSHKLNYIMGNPPFVGYTFQTKSQKEDLMFVTTSIGKKIDYVVGWYFKAASYIKSTFIRTAFVSTNSITQGEQVTMVWKPLFEKYGIHIDFAYKTFRWDSEASIKAHVHCVIIGFSNYYNSKIRLLYDGNKCQRVDNINAYLIPAPNIFIEKRMNPLCSVPMMCKGSQPTDGGNFLMSEDEYDEFIKKEPEAKKYIKPFIGAEEFLNGKKRYCLWLENISPTELSKMPSVLERVQKVREHRLSSKKVATQKWADMPTKFTENRQPNTSYIAIPEISSEKRRYIPMNFLSKDYVCSNKLQIIPDAKIYHFGILMSNVNMAWVKAVCGRLEMRYIYSNTIVYNNFPWPDPTPEQKAKIEETAQGILDARALYPDSSLAELYDELTMPPELRKAHQMNDKAVMIAYGFSIKDMTESSCVAELMKMYQQKADEDK